MLGGEYSNRGRSIERKPPELNPSLPSICEKCLDEQGDEGFKLREISYLGHTITQAECVNCGHCQGPSLRESKQAIWKAYIHGPKIITIFLVFIGLVFWMTNSCR